MRKSKVVLKSSHLRRFVSMDALAKRLRLCRSAVDRALKCFMEDGSTPMLEFKFVRTGKRGPLTKTVRVAP